MCRGRRMTSYQQCVSTGMAACCCSVEKRQIQSATLGPTPASCCSATLTSCSGMGASRDSQSSPPSVTSFRTAATSRGAR